MRAPVTVTDPARDEVSDALTAEAEAVVARSSFYAAMRILPPAQRKAMFEIYRFCRAVDDVADGRGTPQERLAELETWRNDINALFGGTATRRVEPLLAPFVAFALEREDFVSIIDGMEMDARDDIRAPALATLELYCDRVACAVGRLSVRVFGMPQPEGTALAFHLGRALQLTNILRDLDEDAWKGRLYLPRELLMAAGISETEPSVVLAHPALGVVCAGLVASARGHFASAREVMAAQPAYRVRTPRLMASVYRNILERLAARGWTPPRRAISIGRTRLLWILLVDGLFASSSSERH